MATPEIVFTTEHETLDDEGIYGVTVSVGGLPTGILTLGRAETDAFTRMVDSWPGVVEALRDIIRLVDEGDYHEIYDKDMGERPGPSPYESGEMSIAVLAARKWLFAALPPAIAASTDALPGDGS